MADYEKPPSLESHEKKTSDRDVTISDRRADQGLCVGVAQTS